MARSFNEWEEFLEKVTHPMYVDVMADTVWSVDGENLQWVFDGVNYSAEYTDLTEEGDCTLVNYDTGSGETVTAILPNEGKKTVEDFLDKYEYRLQCRL